MNSKKISTLFFGMALLAYNWLFWKEGTGVNLPLFTFMMCVMLGILYPESFKSMKVRIALGGVLLTGAMVFINHTIMSVFAHYCCFIIFVGFVHSQELINVYTAIGVFMSGIFKTHPLFSKEIVGENNQKASRIYRIGRVFRLSILPFGVFMVFYIIYAIANPVFSDWSSRFWNAVSERISLPWFLFAFAGFWLIGVILYRRRNKFLEEYDVKGTDKLLRKKAERIPGAVRYPGTYYRQYPVPSPIGLKNETKIGMIMLASVNLLLLLVNAIDIDKIWFGFKIGEHMNLKEFVHNGTELLILSIVLAIIILVILFQGNQNFYKGNSTLRKLAYCWIAQNIILCISVCLRNSYYIGYHGLAYKRIGVYVFLAMAIFGLITLYFKIDRVKSFFYLCRVNVWALYFLLTGMVLIPWDRTIAGYNLSHQNPSEIDVDFYLDLSDNALPVLYRRMADVEKQIDAHIINHVEWGCSHSMQSFTTILEYRKQNFIDRYESRDWQNFNLADKYTYEYLKNVK